jgi:hypothetical protein
MSTKIIAFAGKKGSGKNSCANFVMGTVMWGLGLVKDTYGITEDGKLYVSDILGNKTNGEGVIDFDNPDPEAQSWLAREVYPFAKTYAYGDLLKEVCHSVLGIKREWLWGTQEDKERKTHLKWEDMPGVLVVHDEHPIFSLLVAEENLNVIVRTSGGPMTVREVMQFVGTEVFRKMYPMVWVNALMNQIQEERPLYAILTDCRFEDECQAVVDLGGDVIKLTRDVNGGEDKHASENGLDNFKEYRLIVDNKELTIPQQNTAVKEYLDNIGFFEVMEAEEMPKLVESNE